MGSLYTVKGGFAVGHALGRQLRLALLLTVACAALVSFTLPLMMGAATAFAQSEPDQYVQPQEPPAPPPVALNDRVFDEDKVDPDPPPKLETLQNIQPVMKLTEKQLQANPALPVHIRDDAMKEAALSYGARGGLAWRTYQIRQEIDARKAYLDKVYDFRSLLITAPSGLLIEPPVISEQDNATLIKTGGSTAAVADRVYNINKNARIIETPRHWRNYLERDWGTVTDPPDILRPQTPEERKKWVEWVREGWDNGIEQADEIFQEDLNQLTSDYRGMVRYRLLLAQGMVTPPYAEQVDRGVTGGGDTMRVGDREVDITGMPALNPGSRTWTPTNR